MKLHSAADIFCGDLPHKNRFIDFEILRCFILQAVRCTMSLFKQYRAIYVDRDIDLLCNVLIVPIMDVLTVTYDY